MQSDSGPSKGASPKSDEVDDLLRARMKSLGLDVDAMGRDYPEVFDKIKKNCPRCGDRGSCAIDLRSDPSSLVWEAYCPNSDVLSALAALTVIWPE
jgi:hypothetical protein